MHIQSLLKNFGLSEKEIAVYMALVELGPSPVRSIAQKSQVNRGTTYDILKALIADGLVSYFDRQSHRYFAAESPEKLLIALENKQERLEEVKQEVKENLPELKLLYNREGGKPQVKLYEGLKGIKQILQDVLDSVTKSLDKTYYVYSASTVRKNVHLAMPDFSKRRVAKKIRVKTIALGEGGKLVGMDERKWMHLGESQLKATYEILYGGKVAHISLDDAQNPVGVVIENEAICQTQKMIFEFVWNQLAER